MQNPLIFVTFCLSVSVGLSDANAANSHVDEFLGSMGFQGNPFESVPVMEKRVKKLVNSGLKKVLPYVMTMATEIELSSGCTNGLLRFIKGILDIRDWSFKMVDALGKPSAGILEGTATALGDYDECLEIVVPKNSRNMSPPPYSKKEIAFKGQYCMIQIDLPEAIRHAAMQYQVGNRSHSVLANSKTFLRNLIKIAPRADVVELRLGVCIPSTCTRKDLQTIVNEVTKLLKIQATALRCEYRNELQLSTDQIIILSTLAVLLFLVICGVLYEAYLRYTSLMPITESDLDRKGGLGGYLLSFSAYNNFKKLLKFEASNPGYTINCVRGMKFISVCLYVVVATYATPHDFHFLKYRSVFHFYKFMEEWWFTVFANASAGVDTLFFITGLQITYSMWKKKTASPNGTIKINIPKFWIKWFLRFSTAQLLAIALFLLLPLIGGGPIWSDVVTPEIEKCRQTWWMNALFINSFYPSNGTCLTNTWILTSIMHLLVLAPLLLYLLNKWASVGIMVIISLILGSSVAIALITMIYDLPPAPAFYFLSFLNINNIWDKLFTQAYDHLSPFCVGIIMGYYMAKHSKVQLSKKVIIFGWVATLICNLAVLCGLYGYRHGEEMEISVSALYASVHRFVWSLGIAWIVFACNYGYGGIINSVLSWNVFYPLDRVSNLTYLLHPLILHLHGGQIREKMYMAHLDQAMYATAYIVFTVAIAALCYICFYIPFVYIESKLFRRCQTSPSKTCMVIKAKSISPSDIIGISIHSCRDDKGVHKEYLTDKKSEKPIVKTA